MMKKKELPTKEIWEIIKKIAPDLQMLLDLMDQHDDDVHDDSVVGTAYAQARAACLSQGVS